MLISKHQIREHGWVKAILYSLISIVAVHAVVIIAHELVDETTPNETGIYMIDRALEPAEVGWAWFWGSDAQAETHLSHAMERFEELEHMLSTESGSHLNVTMAEELLHSANTSLTSATAILESHVHDAHDDLKLFSVVLFAESAAADLVERLEYIGENLPEHLALDIETSLQAFRDHRASHADFAELFAIEESVVDQIRTNSVQRVAPKPVVPAVIESPDTTNQNPEPKPEEPQCRSQGQSCFRTPDCCGERTLICQDFFTSTGRSKRCMPLRR